MTEPRGSEYALRPRRANDVVRVGAREWQACPVCQGRGVVPQGFYNPHPGVVSTSTAPDGCRTCQGARIIERPHG